MGRRQLLRGAKVRRGPRRGPRRSLQVIQCWQCNRWYRGWYPVRQHPGASQRRFCSPDHALYRGHYHNLLLPRLRVQPHGWETPTLSGQRTTGHLRRVVRGKRHKKWECLKGCLDHIRPWLVIEAAYPSSWGGSYVIDLRRSEPGNTGHVSQGRGDEHQSKCSGMRCRRKDHSYCAYGRGYLGRGLWLSGQNSGVSAFGRASGLLQERADTPVSRGIVATEGGHMITSQGAVPIVQGGQVIGACGVGGAIIFSFVSRECDELRISGLLGMLSMVDAYLLAVASGAAFSLSQGVEVRRKNR